ncbi:MAG: DUF2480 family protein [Candidatus Zixiibacteriota bacterium]
MPLFDLESFADDGVFREQSVRERFAAVDWEKYRGKTVHVRGCGSAVVPTWLYLMAAAHLALVARRITFGEERAPMTVFIRPTPTPGEAATPSTAGSASHGRAIG